MKNQSKIEKIGNYGIMGVLLFNIMFLVSIIPISVITLILFEQNIYEIIVSLTFIVSLLLTLLIIVIDNRNLKCEKER